jgi:ubiquinone/menaquinone biosynthesis C-methylase UbiE
VGLYARFFAAIYDRTLAGAERAGLTDRRKGLLSQAHGRTLEIGAGTGVNLEHYPAAVTDLVLAEPEEAMASRLDQRCARAGRPAAIVRASAEHLPFEADSFDTVVATLVLCTVGDVEQALAEISRVLRPGGSLLFLEHVRSDDPKLARWQDRLNPIQQRIACGCNCNRATVASIVASGMQVAECEQGTLEKTFFYLKPLVVGRAMAP